MEQNIQVGSNPRSNKKILVIIGVLVGVLVLFSLYLHFSYPTASPLIAGQYSLSELGKTHATMTKDVVGFLPYWNLDNSKYIRYDLLSELFFFSLTADENGDIVKLVNGQTDPGYRWWKSDTIQNLIAKTQISGTKFGLTVAMQKNDTLEKFLDDQGAQDKLVNNLLDIVKSSKINGLNIDFEYDGTPDDKYRSEFTDFSKKLTSSFRAQSPGTELSVDFFPLSVRKPRLFDVSSLAPLFDKVIVMSYDYYGASADLSGPDAPIFGFIASPSASQRSFIFDVSTTYDDYLKVVPKDKLIMGVPYYGWDYPVEDNSDILATVLPQNDQNGYTEVISYARARTDKDTDPKNCKWDDAAKEHWCSYTDSNNIQREAWIEDNKSIGIKFDFAASKDLGGVAVWTLGYDKDYPDLWSMLSDHFATKK